MGGLLLLIALCGIMAVASFLAGIVPLSISLSQSQLRMVSNIGVGILVGTSMIVIIPEGLGALVPSSAGGHAHSHFRARGLDHFSGVSSRVLLGPEVGEGLATVSSAVKPRDAEFGTDDQTDTHGDGLADHDEGADDDSDHQHSHDEPSVGVPEGPEHDEETELPTFYIGLSMISGFILMFLIDRVPKHAIDKQGAAATREVRLDNLAVSPSAQAEDEETDRFLGSPGESPKQARSVSTTTGLVIHAAADGIAMGASSSTSNARLGFIVFFAILIHKAPAAFGLTSVLLRQGLSKRAARGHLLVFSFAAPFGAIATWLLIAVLGGSKLDGANGQWWTGMLLLFSAGTFLYVAVHAMQDDGHSHDDEGMNGFADPSQRKGSGPQVRDTLATVGGMLLPLLTQIGHH